MKRRVLLSIAAASLVACSPAVDTDATVPGVATDPSNAADPSNPADPRTLVAVMATAAEARDYETLSVHMADAFSYSFGRQPSREDALARYRERPELLDKLADVLDQECAPKTAGPGQWFVCPAAAADERRSYYGWRAGFRQKDDRSWEFVWFIAGD